MSITTTGLTELIAGIRRAHENAGQMMHNAMTPTWEKTFAKSQEYTPVATGALRDSGTIDPPVVAASSTVLSITYGGGLVDYAFWVHERLDEHHAAPTRAKYLETAVNEVIPEEILTLALALTMELLKVLA